MTNFNNPKGGVPIEIISAADYNAKTHKYYIPSTDTNNYFINDFVSSTFTSSDDGIPIVTKTAAGDKIRGIVVGFHFVSMTYGNRLYRQSGESAYVDVIDDPMIELSMQYNGTLTTTDIGKFANLTIGSGQTSNGLSTTQIDSTTITESGAQIEILGIVDTIQNDVGLYTKVRCRINDHDFKGKKLGNTIVVAKSGGDYTTIADAIAVAESGDNIIVQAGTYTESPFTIPENVIMKGEGFPSLVTDDNSNPFITLSRSSVIDTFEITGPTASSAIYYSGGSTALAPQAKNITLVAAQTGVHSTGANSRVIVDTLINTNTTGTDQLLLTTSGGNINAIDILGLYANIAKADSASIIYLVGFGGQGGSNAIYADNASTIFLTSGSLFGATNAIRANNASTIKGTAVTCISTVTYGVYQQDTASVIEIGSAAFDRAKMSFADKSNVRLSFIDVESGSEGDAIIGNFVVEGKSASEIAEDTDFDTDDVLLTGIGSSYGLIIVRESTGTTAEFYKVEHQTLTALTAEVGFSTTKDNAGTYNVYWETDQFKVQNKVGDDKNVKIGFFGLD